MRSSPKKVLLTVGFEKSTQDRLRAAFPAAEFQTAPPNAPREIRNAIAGCDVAVLKSPPPQDIFSEPALKWVHIDQSGLDAVATKDVCERDVIVTSSSGRSAPVLAEHAVFFTLALVYRSRTLEKAQRRRAWGINGYAQLLGAEGRHALIVGLGHTGRALASRYLALGMRVTVFTRRAPTAHMQDVRVFSIDDGDRLDDVLPEIDVLALTASLNDTSYRMIGEPQVAKLKPGTLVVNVARAELICPNALRMGLKSGRIGGFGTDVAYQEPMAPWDPLWGHPNVIITPHVTPKLTNRSERSVDIISENVVRYQNDVQLLNQLQPRDVFTHQPVASKVQIKGWDRRRALRGVAHVWSKLARPGVT